MKHTHLLTFVGSIAFVVVACMAVVGSVPSLAAAHQGQQTVGQDPTSALTTALGAADRIVRVRVAQSASAWNDEHTAIYSTSTLAVRYTLLGSHVSALTVDTVGGYLPAEDLYMISPELPTLSAGEDAILFLADTSAGAAIAGGQDGKYLVRSGQVVYAGGLYEEPIATFFARLQALDAAIALPADWAEREAALAQEPVIDGMDFVYKSIKWPTNLVGYKVHLNSQWIDTQAGSEDDFLTAIRNAAQTWSMVGDADFTLTYVGETESESVANNRSNDIFFDDRGLVDSSGKAQPLAVASIFFSNGLIIDSDIWINDAYDWDATGDPATREIDLESVVLHEMGHWLALGHDPDNRAVMYYSIMSGTLKRALFDNDRRGIEYIYPCAAGSGPCNPTPPPTATPTATATPTVTPTPSPTPTPYATPTPLAQKITRDGGVLDYAPSEDGEINLVVPPNAVVTDTLLSIEHIDTPWEPPAHHHPLIDYFRMSVELEGVEEEAYTFAVPLTMTVTYGTEPVGAEAAQTVVLYAMNVDNARWEEPACGSIQHDVTQRKVIVPICRPSTFGLFAVESAIYLPAIQR